MKRKPKTDRQKLHAKCLTLYSLYRRLCASDANGICCCITCGKLANYKEMDLGHFKHGVLDFDDMNRAVQCTRCNRFFSGKLDEFSRVLLKRYGPEKLEELHIRASMAKKGEFYQEEYLKQLAKDLKAKIEELIKC